MTMICRLVPKVALFTLVGCVLIVLRSSTALPIGSGEHLAPILQNDIEDSTRSFWAASTDERLGDLAWLFSFDEKKQTGEIFVPPRMQKLSKIEFNADGRLDFQSDDFMGQHFHFNGDVRSSGITGRMELLDSQSRRVKMTWQLNGLELNVKGFQGSGERAISSIHYSNLAHSSQGGDLIGADVEIFPTPKSAVGLIVFYESYWGETTFAPLVISKIEKEGPIIRFRAETRGGGVNYHLRIAENDTGLLYRDDAAEPTGVPLKKARSLLSAAPG